MNISIFTVLIAAVAGNIAIAFMILVKGRSLSRQGDWVAGLGLFSIAITSAWSWWQLVEMGESSVSYYQEWIGSGGFPFSIEMGLFLDPTSFLMSLFSSILALLFLPARAFFSSEPRNERMYAGLLLGVSGVTVAWCSLTPWMVLMGVSLSVLGGFFALGCRWNQNEEEADYASRFVRDHGWGFIFAIGGACILSAANLSLRFDGAETWYPYPEVFAGALVLLTGFFLQLRPFPFLGWASMGSQTFLPVRLFSAKILVAWSAFAVLFRMNESLRSIGAFQVFGWVALLVAVLAVIVGLFQRDWKKSLLLWLSASFCVSSSALAFAGAAVGISVLLGTSLGVLGLGWAGVNLERNGPRTRAAKKKFLWSKVSLYLSALSASGFFGFLTFSGELQWLQVSQTDPGRAIAVAGVWFLMVFLIWKIVLNFPFSKTFPNVGWYPILLPLIFLTFSLSVLWTGSVTGGLAPGGQDQVYQSWIDQFFGISADSTERWEQEAWHLQSLWFHFGALLLGVCSAYWMRRSWESVFSLSPKMTQFFSNAFFLDRLGLYFVKGLSQVTQKVETGVAVHFWNGWVPKWTSQLLKGGAFILSRLDSRVSEGFLVGASKAVGVPGKLLQLVQNGDLQWYLFFAVGCGVAMLIHFLKY